MNPFAILFLLLSAVAVLVLPRRWAPLPLLVGACYMTAAQRIEVGPFHFTVLRLLLLVGIVRALARRERLPGGMNGLDWIMLLWGFWLICSSPFHDPVGEALVFRLGMFYNTLGFYFILRLFCHRTEDLTQLIRIAAFILVPVSIEMVSEHVTGRNLFALLGGVPAEVMLRDERFRAQGPFGHPILAGTVGAMCVPLMVGIWRQHRLPATIGVIACLCMVLASLSSGPLMTVVIGIFALVMWRWRRFTHQMRIAGVVTYFLLNTVMHSPAYYLIARIDLTGSSTGWHRARLIESAFEHLGEWWFAGTDYTRHWMPTGVSWSEAHTDITNHYLLYGTWGGLPLMFLFIGALWVAFRYVGHALRFREQASEQERFLIWSIGAGLLSHVVTCISVAYFEQSVMFLYLNLAAIGSLHATALESAKEKVAGNEFRRENSTGDSETEPECDGLVVSAPKVDGVQI